MGNDDKLYDAMFDIKFAAKQMNKSALASEKSSEKEKRNVKAALEKGNPEAARIYAENAIRKHNESLNFLRLSSRLDAAASRIQTAIQMKTVSKAMQSTVKSMDKVLKSSSMDPMKIAQVMDQFEKQQDTLDVNLGTMDAAFQSASAGTVPVGQVDSLLEQVAAENNIDISEKLGAPVAGRIGTAQAQQEGATMEDDIAARLAKLQAL